jgi:Tetratricopeptide repeat
MGSGEQMSDFKKYNASASTQTVTISDLSAEQVLTRGQVDDALMMILDRGISPISNSALHLKAIMYLRRGRYEEAASAIRRLHAMAPSAATFKMMGDLHYLQCRFPEAEESYRNAMRKAPMDAEIVHDYGVSIVAQGRVEESLEWFKRACDMIPDRPDFHHHYAIMLVLAGHDREGWVEMEWRLKVPGVTGTYPFPERYWNGQPLVGKTIVLRSEQGFGDTIMFARYIEGLRARGAKRIYFYCQQEMVEWVRSEYPDVKPWPNKAPPPIEIDYHVNIMSLPQHFPGEYFTRPRRPLNEDYYYLDQHIVCGPKRGIGLCWFGSPTHKADHLRTVPIERFFPLREITSEPWYCVAYGRFDQKPEHIDYIIDECWDWKETADKIKTLRLIITVDTAIAHLAGHHGVPCWLLLPYVPDFRWGIGPGETTPWYESVRIYRQPKLFDWDSVFERVRADLAAHYPREAVAA